MNEDLIKSYLDEIDLNTRAAGGTLETVFERLKARIPSHLAFVPSEKKAEAEAEYLKCLSEAAQRYRTRLARIETFRKPALKADGREKWYVGPTDDARTWHGMRALLAKRGRPPDVINEVDRASTGILSLMDRPSRDKFRSQGLVVGHVQSGKTQAMAALMAKAAGTEYRFFLVLAGLTDVLRKQTQDRLDNDLVSMDPDNWHVWTRTDADFIENTQTPFQFANGVAQLAVIKKNAGVLRRFKTKLKNTPAIVRAKTSFVIIDDECDQASVNAARYIDDMTAINKLIRELMELTPKASYVGFTATPFANVLIDPVVRPGVMPDLYPKDFIYPLEAPKEYFGAERLFGRSALGVAGYEDDTDGYDMIRTVPDDEVALLRPASAATRDQFDFTISPSLERAIAYFLLCVGARLCRGQQSEHSSMLVHTTHFTSVHGRMARAIEKHVEVLARLWSAKHGELEDRMREIWQEEQGRVPSSSFGLAPVAFADAYARLGDVFAELQVKVENSTSESRLDYRKDAPRRYIVVGGNVLARGLTVEGLVVSLFLRTSNQYDTLMQMGRWFGYRPGYEDLPRIWMEDGLRQSFRDLAAVEAEMRMAMRIYHEQDLTPMDLPVKIRQIPGMAITAKTKMHHAKACDVSFGGAHLQTIRFKREGSWLRSNWRAASNLVDAMYSRRRASDKKIACEIFERVPYADVVRFLDTYQVHNSQLHMSGPRMAEYIRMSLAKGRTLLSEWNVAVIGVAGNPQSESPLGKLGAVPMVTRTSLNKDGPDADIKALMSRSDILIDLNVTGDLSWDEAKTQRQRSGSPPLLLLYPIVRDSKPTAAREKSRHPLAAEADVLGLGIVFPEFQGDSSYVSVALPDREAEEIDESELRELEDSAPP